MLPGLGAMGMMAAGAAPAVIASFSQSGNYGGTGVEVASVGNMSDGLFQPFAGTTSGTNSFIRATLASPAYVAAIILGPSTVGSSTWGADYLNGAILEVSDNGGSSWTPIRTLSGYVTATSPTVGTMKTEVIDAICTDIRVRRNGNGYVALSEFKISP